MSGSERKNQTGTIFKSKFQNISVGLRKEKQNTVDEEVNSSWKQTSGCTNEAAPDSVVPQNKDDETRGIASLKNIEPESKQEKTTSKGINASSSQKSEASKVSEIDGTISGKKCEFKELNQQTNDDKMKIISKRTKDPNQQTSEPSYENLLNRIENELSQFENSIKKFQVPFNTNEASLIKENVFDVLNEELKKIPHNVKTYHIIKNFHDRSMQIITNLTNLDAENEKYREALQVINDTENVICQSIQSNDDFCKKKEILQNATDSISALTVNVGDIHLQKMKINNRIRTFLIAEAMKYMRELKKNLDCYKENVKNFAYPRKVYVFKSTTEEIRSLEKLLDVLPRGESCIDKRSQFLRHEIKQVLEILEKKAKFNEEILSSLHVLTEVEKRIESKKSLSGDVCVLNDFNKIRETIGNVGSYNQKLKKRKVEVFSLLHDTENKLYSTMYPEEICLKKEELNGVEKSFQEDESRLSKVQQYRDKLSSLKSDMEVLMKKYSISDEDLTIFRYNFQLLFEILKKAKEENKFKNECLEQINESKITAILGSRFQTSQKISQLEDFETNIKSVREETNKTEIFSTFEKIERMITIEKSILFLKEFNKRFSSIRTTFYTDSKHPFDCDLYEFSNIINEIFDMKECVEDMPEGNPELDSSKQGFLEKMFDLFKTLDKRLDLMTKKNLSEDLNPASPQIDKESTSFVKIIRKKAETFEEQVKYYSGTSNSKDYHVIYDNLMMLREELDNVLQETFESMNYIKGLMKKLNKNASNQ